MVILCYILGYLCMALLLSTLGIFLKGKFISPIESHDILICAFIAMIWPIAFIFIILLGIGAGAIWFGAKITGATIDN